MKIKKSRSKSTGGVTNPKSLVPAALLLIAIVAPLSIGGIVLSSYFQGTQGRVQTSTTNSTATTTHPTTATLSSSSVNETTSTLYNFSTTTTHRTFTTNGSIWSIPQNIRIAFVKPVFTATAYSSFYKFYSEYGKVGPGQNITTNLGLLNASLVNTWGWSGGLWAYLISPQARTDGLFLGKNAFVLSDIDVDQGALAFPNGTRRFDVVVVGFSEYATENEYQNYENYVLGGGRLVFLDACNFLGRVQYHLPSMKVSLEIGHGYAFNGQTAWHSIYDAWENESNKWIGSVFALFYTSGYKLNGANVSQSNPIGQALYEEFGPVVFKAYHPHEENVITNSNDTVIATWNLKGSSRGLLETYELDEGVNGGVVIHSGVFGSDIIQTDREMQFFLREAIYPNFNATQ